LSQAKLTNRIKHALTALYLSRDRLPEDEPKTSKISLEFDTQIKRLQDKLVQISGQKTLDDFIEKISKQRKLVAKGDYGISSQPMHLTNEQLAHELLLDPVLIDIAF
jgi:hypothetical protein